MYSGKNAAEWVAFGSNGAKGATVRAATLSSLTSANCDANRRDEFFMEQSLCTLATKTTVASSDISAAATCVIPNVWSTRGTTNWAGNCGGQVAAINSGYDEILACQNDHNTKLTIGGKNFPTRFNDDVFVVNKAILSDLNAVSGSIETLRTKISSVIAMVKSLGENIEQAFDCRVIRREFQIVQNVFCYQFAINYIHQSLAVAFLGVSLYCFSCCICCSIRCSQAFPVKKGPKTNKINPAPQAQNNPPDAAKNTGKGSEMQPMKNNNQYDQVPNQMGQAQGQNLPVGEPVKAPVQNLPPAKPEVGPPNDGKPVANSRIDYI